MRNCLLTLLWIGLGISWPGPADAQRPAVVAAVPTPDRQRATLHGQVLHAKGRELLLIDSYGNPVAQGHLDAAGRFRLRGWWGSVQGATLRIGNEQTALWLAPGDDLTVTVDARQFDETIRYAGRGARVNNFRAADFLADERRIRHYEQSLAGTAAHFKAWLAADYQHSLARLAAAFPHPSPAEYAYLGYQEGEHYFLMRQNMERSWASDHITRAGMVAPALRATTMQGAPLNMAALRGKVVYVDFWASWCGFCHHETRFARKVQAALCDREADVVFLNVSTDLSRDKWQCALEEEQLEGLNVWSPDSTKRSAWESYLLASLPRYVLIGRDGRVIEGNAPRPSSGAVEGMIRQALVDKRPVAHTSKRAAK